MARLVLMLVLWLVGCGAAPPPRSAVSTRDARAAQGAPIVSKQPPPSAAFRIDTTAPLTAFELEIPTRSNQTLRFAVTERGEIFAWVTPYPRPAPPAREQMLPDFTIRDPSTGQARWLLAPDGAIVPTGHAPEMRCTASSEGRVRCRCWGHTPQVDLTFAIEGEQVMAISAAGATRTGRVTPAPSTAVQRLRALMLVALDLYRTDNHGDAAHDVVE
ncbi:MAG: hypothetical protein IT378_25280 [Sandaracinaceae bacterium]|nr:hypothetical protein [Sandaracinaceae bacterium]